MKKIGKMKKLFFIVALFVQTLFFAQEIEFEAIVQKSTYHLNEKIRLIYSINADGDNFNPPSLADFIAEGPIYGRGGETVVVMVNGQTTVKRVVRTQNTFFLTPKKQGTFTIEPAEIEYEGKIYKSNPVKVTIIAPREIPKDPNDPDYVVGEGLHLVSEISKSSPFINEPITVVYKLYYERNFRLHNLTELESPKYSGFWSQNIDVKNIQHELVEYNGKQYGMAILKKVLLYPLEAGEKEIEALSVALEVSVPKREQFGPFVRTVFVPVTKNLSTGNKKIKVKAFPEEGKPVDFNGAIGKFELTMKPSKTELKSGEALDFDVSVTGTGNLKLFTLPKPEFPSAFEVFDPKHNEKVSTPISGMNGVISDTYTVVPQYKGKYKLKPLTFSYFDLATKTYKTITSEEIEINVLDNPDFKPTVSEVVENEKVKEVKSNVFQEIKTKAKFKKAEHKPFFGTVLFYGLLLVPFLIVPLIVLVRKKKEAIDADEFGNRIKRNNKLAKKYLSEAKKQKGNKVPFYMAMEKALHNFLKAKLHIETSEMSKENIQELLENKQANQETINQFMVLMNDCEFARYAPSTNESMQHDFEKAIEVISELEKQLV